MIQRELVKQKLQEPRAAALANVYQSMLEKPGEQANIPSLAGLSAHDIETTGRELIKERRHAELLKAKTAKEELAGELKGYESIKPFIHAEREDYKAQKQAANIAQSMLKNIDQIEKKWPSALVGSMPIEMQRVYIRDPQIRKFIADSNALVSALAGTRKGVPTNYKLKLEALSKSDLSMPPQTAREILNDVLTKFEDVKDRLKYINTQKNENGKLPVDIEQRTSAFDIAKEDPFNYPDYYKKGTIIEEDDGKRYRLIEKNGKKEWEELNA